MKKSVIMLALFSILVQQISAGPCILDVSLVNQDPYPAIPNDYVELVFQVTGVENPDCGKVIFEVVDEYPFEVQGEAKRSIESGTYVIGYKSAWVTPYKIIIDKDAIDGWEEIETRYYFESGTPVAQTKKFNISIEDSIADFELHVKEYSYKTKVLTIEILNIEDADVEALTFEIPKQANIDIKGSNRIVVGDLDSNEYTSADFESVPRDGEIDINVFYTDQIGVRRSLAKKINFDSSYFLERNGEAATPYSTYLVILVVIVIIVWWILKKRKKKRTEKLMRKHGMAKL